MGVILHFANSFLEPGFFSLSILSALGGTVYLGLHFMKKTEEILLIQKVIVPKTMGLIAKIF